MPDPTKPPRPRPSLVAALLPVALFIATFLDGRGPESDVWALTFLSSTLVSIPVTVGALIVRRPRTWRWTIIIPVVLVTGLYLFWRSETGLRTIRNIRIELANNPDHWRR